jgi:hypothetical protein
MKTVTRDATDAIQRDRESQKQLMLSARGISHSKDFIRRTETNECLEELHEILGFPKDVWHMPSDIEALRQLSQSPIAHLDTHRHSKFDFNPESLGVPSGRRDAELLAAWLDGMQRQLLEKSPVKLEELFEDARLVYTVCLKELVRQVSVHCIERGKLVEMVWKGYLGLLERALSISMQKQEEINKTWADKLHEVETGNKKTVSHIDKVLTGLNRDKAMLRQLLKEREHAISIHELREERLMERIQVIQKHYEGVRKTLMEFKEDNRILKVQLHNTKQTGFAKQPTIKKYKRKSSEELQTELAKDPLLQDMAKITDEELQKPEKINDEITNFEQAEEELFDREDFVSVGIDAPVVVVQTAETQTVIEDEAGDCIAEAVQSRPKSSANSSDNLTMLLRGKLTEAMETTESQMISMTGFLKDILSIKLRDEILSFESQLMSTVSEHGESSAVKTAELMAELKQRLNMLEHKSEENKEQILSSFYDAIAKVLSLIPKSSTDNFETIHEDPCQEIDDEDEDPRFHLKRRVARITSTAAFKLGRGRFAKKLSDLRHSQSVSSAQGLVQKVLNTPVHKLKNVMIKKMLLKTIGMLYEEMNRDSSQLDLKTFVYESLKQKYGLNKVADTKFMQVITSCIKFKSILRIRNFGRFLGLYDQFDKEDLDTYLKALDNLQKLMGKDWHPVYHEEHTWVPLSAAADALGSLENLSASSTDFIKGRLDELKSYYPKTKSTNVQLESCLMLVVDHRRDIKAKQDNFSRMVFDAADINGDGYLSYLELTLLLKCIGARHVDPTEAKKIFEANADITLTNSGGEFCALTFENFAAVNKKHQLFSHDATNRFVGVTASTSVEYQMASIKTNLNHNILELEWRYSFDPCYSEKEAEIAERLESLRNKILDNESADMLLLAFRLTEYESKSVLVEAEVEDCLPVLRTLVS